MPTFDDCTNDQYKILNEARSTYHDRLEPVSITLLQAYAKVDKYGNIVGPALRDKGYPALAIVAIVPYKQRAAGLTDVLMLIDADRWPNMTDPVRLALMDHELTHLEPDVDKHGAWKHDDLGRPKLKIRRHDHSFGWFDEVAERHGAASIEISQARRFTTDHGQLYLKFDSQGSLVFDDDPGDDAHDENGETDERTTDDPGPA